MRTVKKQIFMGNGDESMKDCNKLKQRLSLGLTILSGLQQPNHWDYQPTKQEIAYLEILVNRDKKELEDIVQDVAMGLLGKDIQIL